MRTIDAVKTTLKKNLLKVMGSITSQVFWERVYQLSLDRMNFGNGGDFNDSGELFVAKYIQKKLKNESPLIIFDVGANVGDYSRAISAVFNSNARIYSFEPSKKTYELFLASTKDHDNIIPNNIGFSDKVYNQLLFTDSDGSGFASVYQRNLAHFGMKMDTSEEIALTTIDRYCLENGIERMHFLKLDIEGHELSALKGASEMIADKKIDFIQFEFGGCNIDSRTYFQDFYYLLKDNYRIYRILKDDIREVHGYKETYEIFMNINYLAIRKQLIAPPTSGAR